MLLFACVEDGVGLAEAEADTAPDSLPAPPDSPNLPDPVETLPGDTRVGPTPGLCQAALDCPREISESPSSCSLQVQAEDGTVHYAGGARVWLRGRSSASAPKPQYRVELVDAEGVETGADLLHMGTESDWILHGNYYDRSLVRNSLGFALYAAMDEGEYAPESAWCELSLDGDPRGVYSLVERIERDDDRLDLVADDGSGASFVVGLDDEEYFVANSLGYGGWELVYPDADASGGIAAFLGGMNEDTLASGRLLDWVDLDSAVDIVILEELMRNNDGWYLSLHAWRDAGGLLHFVPWDLDLTLGQPSYNDNENPEGWILYRPDLPGALGASRDFRERLAARWAELREGPLADEAILARIDAHQATLGEAIDRNFEIWPIESIDFGGYLYPVHSYAEEDARVRAWIPQRTAWIDANIGEW